MSAFLFVLTLSGVKQDGAGGITAVTIFSQLAAALVLDHYGWLGVERQPVNAWKIAGAVLLFGGALLMQKR